MKTQPKKIGLVILRMQPFHLGHKALIDKMLSEMDMVIIGLGSSQSLKTMDDKDKEYFVEKNPIPWAIRQEMLYKVYGKSSKIKIIPLHDIGATIKYEWIASVLTTIQDKELPFPTDFYAGSNFDASWVDSFNKECLISKKSMMQYIMNVIIFDRNSESINVSATEIRNSFKSRDDSWKSMVPPILINDVQEALSKLDNIIVNDNDAGFFNRLRIN